MRITLNGEEQQAEPDSTVASLLRDLEIPADQVAVEVNLDLIPRSQHQTHKLSENDQIEVVRLVGGG